MEALTWVDYLTLVLVFAAAGITFLCWRSAVRSAVAAELSNKQVARMATGKLLSTLMEHYSSIEMCKSTREVLRFACEKGREKLVEEWIKAIGKVKSNGFTLQRETAPFVLVDDGRRALIHHFVHIMVLYNYGLLDRYGLYRALNPSQARLVLEVLWPMTQCIQGHDPEVFTFCEECYRGLEDKLSTGKDPFEAEV